MMLFVLIALGFASAELPYRSEVIFDRSRGDVIVIEDAQTVRIIRSLERFARR